MQLTVDKSWRVRAAATIEAPMCATVVWGQMRDARRFLALDPLHRSIETPDSDRPLLRRGDRLRIPHRLAGLGPDRIGRVLRWDEGTGYVISDLSRRGARAGFPHVCAYRLETINESRCRLIVEARGKWTMRWIPRPLVLAWLAWVLGSTRRRIELELATVMALRRRAGISPAAARPASP
jgi:hypothetical protein